MTSRVPSDRRTAKRWFLFGALGVAVCLVCVPLSPAPVQTVGDAGYADPQSCASCHRSIWESYQKTGMGRAFSVALPATVGDPGTYYHKASDSYFSVLRRDDGRFYQRWHQLDAAGRASNIMEKSIDFVMGSGNHARTFLHRTARNTLVELPLGWYADKGGYYAMNPGYDRVDHEGFRRKIGYDCMFCHNGYPRIPAGHDQPFAEPVYLDPLPQGIDCQRCHGPGARHATLAGTAGAKAADIRAAIVNPKRLSAERREEVCIQCHLESTSFALPNSLARYDRGPFAYKPGEPLSASWLFFDHAPGTGRDDKFEIVNAVYRMRKSKCFLESKGALECGSCHNPHDVPRGEDARRHYDAACRNCHPATEKHPAVAASAEGGCADCHMPKRRTEDVVHAVATDHLIQRHKPAGDLLAARQERHESGDNAYRGEVVLYYPEKLPHTPENESYLALAQVVDKSNLSGGIRRLEAAIAKQPRARAEFYIGLAEAWQASGQPAKALPLYREAVRRNPLSVFALQKLGLALRHSGALEEAAAVLKRATAADMTDVISWHELGLTYREQDKMADAITAFENAISLDPDVPEPHSNLGSVLLAAGEQARSESAFREAIRIQPDYADAHDNLGTLLAGRGEFVQARDHFEAALRLRPRDARTRYNFAMALGRAQQFDEAQRQLEEAVRVDSEFADARLVLGDLLLAKQQASAALPHYRESVRIDPESGRARLGLGTALALTGDRAGAVEQLRKAATAADAQVRESAAALLQELGVR